MRADGLFLSDLSERSHSAESEVFSQEVPEGAHKLHTITFLVFSGSALAEVLS